MFLFTFIRHVVFARNLDSRTLLKHGLITVSEDFASYYKLFFIVYSRLSFVSQVFISTNTLFVWKGYYTSR